MFVRTQPYTRRVTWCPTLDIDHPVHLCHAVEANLDTCQHRARHLRKLLESVARCDERGVVDPTQDATRINQRPELSVTIEVLRRPGRKHDPASFGDSLIEGANPLGLRSWPQRIAELGEAILLNGLLREGGDCRARTDALDHLSHALCHGRFAQVFD